MWVLLTGGVRRWLLFTVAVPLGARAARRLAGALDGHEGAPRGVSRALVRAATLAERSRKPAGGLSALRALRRR